MAKIIIFVSEVILVMAASIGIYFAFGLSAFIGSLFSAACGIGMAMNNVEYGRFAIADYYNMELPGKDSIINIVANIIFAGIAVVYYNHYWTVAFLLGWAIAYIVRMVSYYFARLIYKMFS